MASDSVGDGKAGSIMILGILICRLKQWHLFEIRISVPNGQSLFCCSVLSLLLGLFFFYIKVVVHTYFFR